MPRRSRAAAPSFDKPPRAQRARPQRHRPHHHRGDFRRHFARADAARAARPASRNPDRARHRAGRCATSARARPTSPCAAPTARQAAGWSAGGSASTIGRSIAAATMPPATAFPTTLEELQGPRDHRRRRRQSVARITRPGCRASGSRTRSRCTMPRRPACCRGSARASASRCCRASSPMPSPT